MILIRSVSFGVFVIADDESPASLSSVSASILDRFRPEVRVREPRGFMLGEKSQPIAFQTKLRLRRILVPTRRTLQTYVQEHSEARFTHGVCPRCADTLHADVRSRRAA
jgi:hypothetical protein